MWGSAVPTGSVVRRLLVIPPILAGAALIAWQLGGRTAPEQAAPAETVRSVRVIEVAATDFVPRALGFGFAQPGAVWEAVSQVAGKIVYRHPDLERGRVLPAGTTILRLDPTDYELAVARGRAGLDSLAAQLDELTTREDNTKALLAIERRAATLAEADLERKAALLAKGNASQATVDQAESSYLARREKVRELENQLALMPAERRLREAEQALRQAELEQAALDLARTEIRLPFDARIAEAAIEETQFAAVNQTLAVADSIDVAEVSAQMAFDHVRALVPPGQEIGALSVPSLSVLPRRWGLSARVRMRIGELDAAWDARLDRISDTVDPQTRTIGFIVAVDDPYRQAIPGIRPPLIKNMFVEVELRAPARPDRIVVPRVALHVRAEGGPAVYLAGPDDRLEIRSVQAGAAQSDFVVIEAGLAAGERVVVSDLVPAIEGMALAPRADPKLAHRLREQAAGRSELR